MIPAGSQEIQSCEVFRSRREQTFSEKILLTMPQSCGGCLEPKAVHPFPRNDSICPHVFALFSPISMRD
jgi:hypothetical protein